MWVRKNTPPHPPHEADSESAYNTPVKQKPMEKISQILPAFQGLEHACSYLVPLCPTVLHCAPLYHFLRDHARPTRIPLHVQHITFQKPDLFAVHFLHSFTTGRL